MTLGSFPKFFRKFASQGCTTTSINDTGGKFATDVNYTGGNLPLVPTALAPNFATAGVIDTSGKLATGFKDTGDTFAASVIDNGCKFSTGVIDTCGKQLEQYQTASTLK
jgi:hypothetical protein